MNTALDGTEVVTDGMTRMDFAEQMLYKKSRVNSSEELQKWIAIKTAGRYIRQPAANPHTTPQRKISSDPELSESLINLSNLLEGCLQSVEPSAKAVVSLEFLRRFNAAYPMKLEVIDGEEVKLTLTLAMKANEMQGLAELLFAIPVTCPIQLTLFQEALGEEPLETVQTLIRYIGRAIRSLKFHASKDSYDESHQEALVQLIKESPQLLELDLSANEAIASADLKALIFSAKSFLQRINLSDNPQLLDEDARLIAINCPRLQTLFLARGTLTDRSLSVFISECSMLQTIDLSKCAFSEKIFVTPWTFTGVGTALHQITIEESEVSDETLLQMLERVPTLTTLNLARCCKITYNGVLALLRKRGTLSLDLRHCPNLSQTALSSLKIKYPYATLLFEEKESPDGDSVSKDDEALVCFTSYLAAFFQDVAASALRKDEKSISICLHPLGLQIDAIRPFINASIPKIERLLAKYDVHLEIAYEALTVCPRFHPLGRLLAKLAPYVTQLDVSYRGKNDQDPKERCILSKWPFPKLERLSLNVAKLTDAELLLIQAPQAKSLSLRGCRMLTQRSFFSLSRRFPWLQSLDLSQTMVSDSDFCSDKFHLRHLTTLLLAHTGIGDDVLKVLGAVDRKIGTLDLSATKIGHRGLESLELLPLITKLELNGCPQVDDEALCQLKHRANIFKEISMRDCVKVTDAGIWAVLQSCKELNVVDAEGCRVDPTIVQALKAGKRNEPELTLNLQRSLSYYGFGILFHMYPNLTSLLIQNCPNQTALHEAVAFYPELQSLTLEGGELTDPVLESISKKVPKISSLKLHNLPQITAKGTGRLIQALKYIRDISVESCLKISQAELLALRKMVISKENVHGNAS